MSCIHICSKYKIHHVCTYVCTFGQTSNVLITYIYTCWRNVYTLTLLRKTNESIVGSHDLSTQTSDWPLHFGSQKGVQVYTAWLPAKMWRFEVDSNKDWGETNQQKLWDITNLFYPQAFKRPLKTTTQVTCSKVHTSVNNPFISHDGSMVMVYLCIYHKIQP